MTTYTEIIQSQQAIALKRAVAIYGAHCRDGYDPPSSIEKLYKECLDTYRKFLDEKGMNMNSSKNRRLVNNVD